MADKDVFKITLQLGEIDEFFSAPKLSPLSENYRVHSNVAGIEFIGNELYANTSYKTVTAKLLLPNEKIEPDLLEKTKAGVRRYSQARLRDVEQELRATRWRGLRVLIAALIVLFVFVGAAKILARTETLIPQIIAEGLSIAGWVALWFPLELLTITFWQHRLDRKIYTLLSGMELSIEPSN